MLDAVEKLLERCDKPSVDLGQQLRAVSEITRRGNLEINLNNGDVKLKRRIVFKKRNPGDSPTAEFENEQESMDVLRDIAELWQMLPVPVVVEGHTKDIGAGTDQFWQDVANSRAALCAATLGMMGVDLGQIVAVGKPGKSGLNKATLVVHFDVFPDIKHSDRKCRAAAVALFVELFHSFHCPEDTIRTNAHRVPLPANRRSNIASHPFQIWAVHHGGGRGSQETYLQEVLLPWR
eukprot:symbB.v1.2.018334.t1/scaffold1417.1/size119926/8